MIEIEEIHRAACARGEDMYEDPNSGLAVFTEFAHRARGFCCGSGCRHCPYRGESAMSRRQDRSIVQGIKALYEKFVKALFRLLSGLMVIYPVTKKKEGVHKSKVYTKSGDNGYTRILAGARLAKYDHVVEAMGELDELSTKLGCAAYHCKPLMNYFRGGAKWRRLVIDRLHRSQVILLDAGAVLAGSSNKQEGYASRFTTSLATLEIELDSLDATLPPLRNFILPRGPMSALALHEARVVCRRAERHVWKLVHENATEQDDITQVAIFLNRLSDFLFVAARTAVHFQYGDPNELSYAVKQAQIKRVRHKVHQNQED